MACSNNQSSTQSHPFQATLPNPRTLAHNSFIPRTSKLRNTLHSTAFPESYNLSSFKSNIELDLISLSTLFSKFFFCRGVAIGPTDFPRHHTLKKDKKTFHLVATGYQVATLERWRRGKGLITLRHMPMAQSKSPL